MYGKQWGTLAAGHSFVFFTTSHLHCIWTCNEIEGSYDKIIIRIIQSYTGKMITSFFAVYIIMSNNVNNVIFSSIPYSGKFSLVQIFE